MRRLRFESRMPASAAELWAFHRSAEALHALTPWPIRIALAGDLEVRAGARQVVTSSLGPTRSRWVARIEACDENGFVDVAEEGPFRSWRHQHTFLDGALIDEVEFSCRCEALVAVGVRALFWFRHRKTTRAVAKTTFVRE